MEGQPFSIIHGDLITEVTINREVKVDGISVTGRYTTSDQKNDTFIKTSHIMVNIWSKLKVQDYMLSSYFHKEVSPGSRKYHDNIVTDMKEKNLEYCDPFFYVPAPPLKKGGEIGVNIRSIIIHRDKVLNVYKGCRVENEST